MLLCPPLNFVNLIFATHLHWEIFLIPPWPYWMIVNLVRFGIFTRKTLWEFQINFLIFSWVRKCYWICRNFNRGSKIGQSECHLQPEPKQHLINEAQLNSEASSLFIKRKRATQTFCIGKFFLKKQIKNIRNIRAFFFFHLILLCSLLQLSESYRHD